MYQSPKLPLYETQIHTFEKRLSFIWVSLTLLRLIFLKVVFSKWAIWSLSPRFPIKFEEELII